MSESCRPQDYALHAFDKLRYGDTARQGHVNSAVYATIFETGRIELLYDSAGPVREPGSALVIAVAMRRPGPAVRRPGKQRAVAVGNHYF
jgi:acyl-CoA thioester hydrolase